MKKKLNLWLGLFAILAATLSACGGGGSSSSSTATTPVVIPPVAATWPSAGDYSAVLTTGGTTGNLQMGISLVHPSAPTTEYPIQTVTSTVTDLITLYSGLTNTSTGIISNVKPHAALYIVGGDLKRINLAADGTDPKTKIKSLSVSYLCGFKNEIDAQDYDVPNNSKIFTYSKGADGVCGTADDQEVEITFASNDAPFLRFGATSRRTLGVMRDPVNLKPIAFVRPDGVAIDVTGVLSSLRSTGSPLITKVISQAVDAAVVEDNNHLTVLAATGRNPNGLGLDGTVTFGVGWKEIGYDANNFYVYRTTGDVNNVATLAGATWKIVKITRNNPIATVLASGNGTLMQSSMGTNVLFATVLSGANISLFRIGKTLIGAPTLLESGPTTTLPTVLTNANGVHMLWRVTGAGSSAPGFSISMIDEVGTTLYSALSAFPSGLIEPSRRDLAVSENRGTFTFYTGYGALAHSGAALKAYDTASKRLVNVGTLPGTADFGALPAYSTNAFNRAGFLGGFIAPIQNGAIQASSGKVFTFDVTTDNSLKITTSKQ
jgi:hypothetical protein